MRSRSGVLRTLLTGLLSVGLLLSPSSAAAADGGHDSGQPPNPDPAPSPLGTARGWTEQLQEKNDWTWSGADQATSVQASNGAVYWLYGDTVLGTENPGTGAYDDNWRMIANTIFVQRDGVLVPATAPGVPAIPDVANPSADAVPGNTDDRDRYWPMAAIEHGGYLNVFAQRVRPTPGQGLGFQLVGADLARFRFSGDNLIFEGMAPTPSTGVGGAVGPQWAGTALESGGYAYVYGHKHTNDPFNPHSTYLARVPTESLTDVTAWQYWNGCAWEASQGAAAAIFDSQPSSVAVINGKWTVLVKPWNETGTAVHAWTSDNPQGPYQSRVLFYEPAGTTPQGRSYVTYSPQLHPEQRLASGATLVSLAWAGKDFWTDTVRDADLYKPRFYEVTF